ncbi:DEAD/DEAH box helicase [Candidatus Dependentiae bacterium]|nr:DEAD/DEAH box helicase [Candidatus Dependentiae bacterium]
MQIKTLSSKEAPQQSSQEVLHGIWQPEGQEGLHLWMETASPSENLTSSQKNANYHPYALDHPQLQQRITTDLLPSNEERLQQLLLSLPTDLTTQLPCSSWESPSSSSSVSLAHWHIPSFHIPKDEIIVFLMLLGKKNYTYKLGSSLSYWHTLGLFVLELIEKGAFYPTMELSRTSDSYKARWKPLFTDVYTTYLDELSLHMPPVCRSFVVQEYSASFLSNHFIQEILDTFIKKHPGPLASFVDTLSSSDPLQEPLRRWLTQLLGYDNELHHTFLPSRDHATNSFATELLRQVTLCETNPTQERTPVITEEKKQFKLLFKLEYPETAAHSWKLSFFLQATDDPSLLLSAESLWNNDSSGTEYPSSLILNAYEDPQDRLLQELLKASRIVGRLTYSLEQKLPSPLVLSTAEAYEFLQHEAPLLCTEGFTLQLPYWWHKPRKKLRSRVHIKRPSLTGTIGSDALLDYDWQVSLGEHVLSEQEFKELTALKEPLVNIRGEWITIDRKELSSALALFQQKRASSLSLTEALRLAWEKEDTLTGFPLESVTTEQWLTDLIQHLQDPQQIAPLITPSSFKGQLRPYQERGLAWLSYLKDSSFGACLADDMGLGKTIQIIALLLHQKNSSRPTGPHLLICPLSVLGNWQHELARFAPSLTFMVHHSPDRPSKDAFKRKALAYDLVITTYAISLRDHEELLSLEWESIILDEAQHIKNGSSKQTRVIKTLRSRSRIALTGTPLENRLGELWSLMDFLNKGYLGTEESFHKKFTLPIERYNNQERASALKSLVNPFILRRVKTDTTVINDLPEKIETKELCHLTKEQASLYQSVLDTMLYTIEQAEGIQRRGLILSTLMKLKQICNHPAQFMRDNSSLENRSGKIIRLEELLDEVVAKKEKSLIFTQFATMGELLHKHLSTKYQEKVPFLYGGTTQKERDALVQRFQDPKGPPLFVLSLKAGGIGLNLTEANHVFHFDRWWNPAVENQATDRAFRIGQKNIVHVHKFICTGTLEERIDRLIEQKKQLTDLIITGGEHWITELSTQELKDLFSLTP